MQSKQTNGVLSHCSNNLSIWWSIWNWRVLFGVKFLWWNREVHQINGYRRETSLQYGNIRVYEWSPTWQIPKQTTPLINHTLFQSNFLDFILSLLLFVHYCCIKSKLLHFSIAYWSRLYMKKIELNEYRTINRYKSINMIIWTITWLHNR